MTAEDYLRNRQQVAIRQQIVEAISDGLQAPDAFLEAVALYRGEDRTIDYLAVPRSLVEPIEEPGEFVLKTWFEERKATYAAPEYRKIAYIKLDPEALADPSAISDEQVQEGLRRARRRATPRRKPARSSSWSFRTPEAAKAAFDSTRTGATFDDLVKARARRWPTCSSAPSPRRRCRDPAIADAVFKLSANEISQRRRRLVRPGAAARHRNHARGRQAADRSGSARSASDLAVAEATRILLDAHDSYEDARAGGATLAEAAAKLNLKVVTVDAIDRQALRPDGTIVDDLPESPELLKQAFETEVGIENPAINIGSTGYVFYEVQGVTPARDRTLDEVHDKVVADWKAAEAEKRLDAKAAELAKRSRTAPRSTPSPPSSSSRSRPSAA